jgi:hypothetical protein
VFFGNEKSVRYVLTRRPSLFAVEEAQMLAMLRYHMIIIPLLSHIWAYVMIETCETICCGGGPDACHVEVLYFYPI